MLAGNTWGRVYPLKRKRPPPGDSCVGRAALFLGCLFFRRLLGLLLALLIIVLRTFIAHESAPFLQGSAKGCVLLISLNLPCVNGLRTYKPGSRKQYSTMKQRRTMRFLSAVFLLTLLLPLTSPQQAGEAQAAPAEGRSFFGMNLYITGLERPKDEKLALVNAARDIGVKWSREEMSWANLEPDRKGIYNWGAYDPWINSLVGAGINVVGSLQTSPSWASGVASADPDWYWYVPRNPQDFADFAYAAAVHYAGKIKVWEIWNEPDVDITFKCKGSCDKAAIYSQMLAASYAGIKRADPGATVLIGGLSVHDYNNQGMAFLDRVVAASNGKINFDVLSIHPYMPDRPPESTDPKTVVQNFPYRLENAYKWLQAHNATNKEIWVTEDGYSTCTPCNGLGVTEDEQAVRLVRLNVIAMASPGVTQFDYFQLKDKFNAGENDLWGNMGIMRNDRSYKPAYKAYKVMTTQLEGAVFTGQGPLMRAVPNRWQTQYDRYHYKFAKGNSVVQVLWSVAGPETVQVPVSLPNVAVLNTGGQKVDAPRQGNNITLTLSETPLYIVETQQASGNVDPATDKASPTGFRPSARFIGYWQKNGGLPLFGYPITGERLETSPTNGKQYIVQWFERARFEYHPEYAGTPAEVLLGLLGGQLVAWRAFPRTATPDGVQSVCAKETGHCVWGRFLDRWRELGVPIVGLPLSDQLEERSTDGKTYTVQYFERARFEYHPENAQPYDVLLGLLGRQLFRP